ncbi:MAG: hypothetical protein COW03_12170 [Cytophagales bacterium CG12_big_fil_rev_8_21_14_0_65_40_12]|nr:MAG: hypothetical protein COW03_12170 [Cytophagales bacterium CG12_big_fil_rev_8_21_14_0_65_40_12]PIW04853.1 MAG: hypothetical protein COW40_07250 [Cytophagales bacterium CG17_big_fil_post_rev_8_21_14_2_50_40_13]
MYSPMLDLNCRSMIKRFWTLIQNLSLDITAGAVISSLYVAKVFSVLLSSNMLFGLGIAIWLIYTIDHLLDAHFASDQPKNRRHAFHQRHKNKLLILGAIIFLVGLINLTYLPFTTIKFGLVLAAFVLFYFGSLHLLKISKTWHKEILAAVIYTVGVFAAPFSQMALIGAVEILFLIQFFLLVLSNLFLFPLFEFTTDCEDKLQSIVTIKGKRFVRSLILVLVLMNSALIGFAVLNGQSYEATMVLFAMNLTLFILWKWPFVFQINDRYRFLGDGIFFLPLIYLLL